jgi:hypothetical protein
MSIKHIERTIGNSRDWDIMEIVDEQGEFIREITDWNEAISISNLINIQVQLRQGEKSWNNFDVPGTIQFEFESIEHKSSIFNYANRNLDSVYFILFNFINVLISRKNYGFVAFSTSIFSLLYLTLFNFLPNHLQSVDFSNLSVFFCYYIVLGIAIPIMTVGLPLFFSCIRKIKQYEPELISCYYLYILAILISVFIILIKYITHIYVISCYHDLHPTFNGNPIFGLPSKQYFNSRILYIIAQWVVLQIFITLPLLIALIYSIRTLCTNEIIQTINWNHKLLLRKNNIKYSPIIYYSPIPKFTYLIQDSKILGIIDNGGIIFFRVFNYLILVIIFILHSHSHWEKLFI